MPFFLAAPKASGKACTTPWSVMAMALWPHFAACLMRSPGDAQASMVEKEVCRCSSTRFSVAVSLRTGFSAGWMSETMSTISCLNSS